MALELADIFRRYGPAYRQKYATKLLPSHRKAMRATPALAPGASVEHCRTEALGGQVYHCPACDETHYSYHSCRNRHCPKCQQKQAEDWLQLQRELLLPVPYFLLTFTPCPTPPNRQPEPEVHLQLLLPRLTAFWSSLLWHVSTLVSFSLHLSIPPDFHVQLSPLCLTRDWESFFSSSHLALTPKANSRAFLRTAESNSD